MTSSEERRIDREIHKTTSGSDPFAAAMRATRMPMIITDPRQHDNPIVFVNDAFARLTGYTREECMGRNCRFLQGPGTNTDDVAKVRDAIAAREPIEIDLLNYKKDGGLFWNRLLVSPVFDGEQLTYFFASQFDVTRERTIKAIEDQEEHEAEMQRRIADLTASEERLNFTLKAGGLGTWTLDIPTKRLVCSALCKINFGRNPADNFSYEDLNNAVHPDDRGRWHAAVEEALGSDGQLKVEYRAIRPDGEVSWMEVRAETRFDAEGRPLLMSGVSIDITERKEAESYRAMMAQEMAHRMKNMLATVQSIINQSMRGEQPPEVIRGNITSRLDALSRSHDVLSGRNFDSASMQETVERAIEPFNAVKRIHFFGPDIRVSHQGSSSLSLALHELATNAVKYGALSNDAGRVRVEWSVNGDAFQFVWKESGGPTVEQPERSGFGSRLIRMLGMSLKGSAVIDYDPAGVIFTATTMRSALSPVE
jgi:PAS domain S-box-containing protein